LGVSNSSGISNRQDTNNIRDARKGRSWGSPTASASATDRILTTTRMPDSGDLGGLQQLQKQQQTGY
jgi:hypothetical protein